METIPFFYLSVNGENIKPNCNLKFLKAYDLFSGKELASLIGKVSEDYFILYTGEGTPEMGEFAIERMLRLANDSGAGILYSDFAEKIKGEITQHPLNDYQNGSLRDDFDFGPLLFVCTKAAKEAARQISTDTKYAAIYDLRLAISRSYPLVHINESLFTIEDSDTENIEKNQFKYVDPKNRAVQIEMEEACTRHLKAIGAWLPPVYGNIDLNAGEFPVEATVIIPVRNRCRTIKDAICSVLEQETDFSFNLIVIDNHSTDGTTEIIADKAKEDSRVIHLIPERLDLGIGGCWNEGVHHSSCGRFAVQLDSDDIYSSKNTLARVVSEFYIQNCAMLVGSYRICNFQMETIPPGIIDHREWTDENGRNNVIRINGLGAPRAFFTPLLREAIVPNVNYGEDYALGLMFSREWKIGRIYDVIYLCRRWEGNSDSSISLAKANVYNAYKDKLRSLEIAARISKNKK